MKGTEKQVKWASEIVEKMNVTLKQYLEKLEKNDNSISIVKEATLVTTLLNRINQDNVYAGDIITLFKRVLYSKDFESTLSNIAAPLRVSVPSSNGEYFLLCRDITNT